MKIIFLILLAVPMISRYVSVKEAYGVSTVSTKEASVCQQFLVKEIATKHFDALRQKVGKPLYISSAFRTVEKNTAVGGAKNSDHMVLGDVVAFDIDQDGKGSISNAALFEVIRAGEFYKLIWEFGDSRSPQWVHTSWSLDESKNKLKYAYRARKVNNRTIYETYN